MSVFGVLVSSMSVGFFKRAAFGVDPFQTFMSGLSMLVPIEFGTLCVIVSLIFLMFSLIADRHYIGVATMISMFISGYIIQYSLDVLMWLIPEVSLAGRFVLLIVGIVMLCFASSFYFTADMGVSVYDAISLILANTWHIGKFRTNRIITDLICVCVGTTLYFIAGGKLSGYTAVVGAGTIITAFFMGPLIDYFNRHVAQPFLEHTSSRLTYSPGLCLYKKMSVAGLNRR